MVTFPMPSITMHCALPSEVVAACALARRGVEGALDEGGSDCLIAALGAFLHPVHVTAVPTGPNPTVFPVDPKDVCVRISKTRSEMYVMKVMVDNLPPSTSGMVGVVGPGLNKPYFIHVTSAKGGVEFMTRPMIVVGGGPTTSCPSSRVEDLVRDIEAAATAAELELRDARAAVQEAHTRLHIIEPMALTP
jgi:hypothetical protein